MGTFRVYNATQNTYYIIFKCEGVIHNGVLNEGLTLTAGYDDACPLPETFTVESEYLSRCEELEIEPNIE